MLIARSAILSFRSLAAGSPLPALALNRHVGPARPRQKRYNVLIVIALQPNEHLWEGLRQYRREDADDGRN